MGSQSEVIVKRVCASRRYLPGDYQFFLRLSRDEMGDIAEFKQEFLPLLNALVDNNLVANIEANDEDEGGDEDNEFALDIHQNVIEPLVIRLERLGVPPANLQLDSMLRLITETLEDLQGEHDVAFFEIAYPGQGNVKWNELHALLIAMRNRIQHGNAMNQEGGRRRSRRRRGGRRVSRRRRGGRRVSRKRRGRRGTKKNSF